MELAELVGRKLPIEGLGLNNLVAGYRCYYPCRAQLKTSG